MFTVTQLVSLALIALRFTYAFPVASTESPTSVEHLEPHIFDQGKLSSIKRNIYSVPGDGIGKEPGRFGASDARIR
ncbi:hypothetical protein Clacol_003080 [Clathrus columnatus]|uniref:Uncharacterized protein n=1 Tax=Clathrus columnatus TaxID=1419009 RepID=A0AAV5AAA8_9AGAM|nr:hypothetical protein Clacol_003080 [Clathrus columnatus]